MKIAIVSLGCPKNQVDADVFCRTLLAAGHETVPSIDEAELVIVNTCGFLDAAKEEAIEHILDACALKKSKPALKVVVTGCLAERYKSEVAAEIPEVDAVVGIGKNSELVDIVEKLAAAGTHKAPPIQCYGEKAELAFSGSRIISTPGHYAYLKIAEGCSNVCSYCAIPSIRGPLRSRPLQDCVNEAAWLAQQGVKELILVAQDVTAYGADTGEVQIARLLDALQEVEGLCWIRILYAYPERITEEFLEAMCRNSKVLPYLDLPIQHCNEEILRSMHRRGGAKAVHRAIRMARQKMPDLTLRTSLIVGYPGESEEQFEELCQFVKDVGFERLGCFAYSPEEGTEAAEMPNQCPEELRRKRVETLMELQERILQEKQKMEIGKTCLLLCDGSAEEEGCWLCRRGADAPEIDTLVYLETPLTLQPGRFYTAEIVGEELLDLRAINPKPAL